MTTQTWEDAKTQLLARNDTPCELCPDETLDDVRANKLDPNDPNIKQLEQIAAAYHNLDRQRDAAKAALDRQIAAMKQQGYSYPVLAKFSGIAMASVQYAVAKEAQR